jgi:sugar/nucleoside kinase (ribokinase family)
VKNNAKIGTQIAVALAGMKSAARASEGGDGGNHKVVVFGGAVVDVLGKADKLLPRTTSMGGITVGQGGVGRNIAEALARLGGVNPLLVTALANDFFGEMSLRYFEKLGMSTNGIVKMDTASHICAEGSCTIQAHRTALCSAIMDENGD